MDDSSYDLLNFLFPVNETKNLVREYFSNQRSVLF